METYQGAVDNESLLPSERLTATKTRAHAKTLLAFVLLLGVVLAVVILASLDVFSSSDVSAMSESTCAEGQLGRYEISDVNAICNDGSRGNFFWRAGTGAHVNDWIIRFNGGNQCWDGPSCVDRWGGGGSQHADEMETDDRDCVDGDGCLNDDSTSNAYFHEWNAVEIHYCSSDDWLGTSVVEDASLGYPWVPFYFHGSSVVRGAINDLLGLGMDKATNVLLAGNSVGGQQLYHSFDDLEASIHAKAAGAKVFGLADSGWWVEDQSYYADGKDESPTYTNEIGYASWAPDLNGCEDSSSMNGREFYCIFAQNSYPYLSDKNKPFFMISQQQYDHIHLNSEGCTDTIQDAAVAGTDDAALEFMEGERDLYRADIASSGANVWSTPCSNHDIINKDRWDDIEIPTSGASVGLDDAIAELIDNGGTATVQYLYTSCDGYDCMETCQDLNT